MENTLGNQTDFFLLYRGQKVLRWHQWIDKNEFSLVDFQLKIGKGWHLLLTPLSQITDEHAIEVAKAVCVKFSLNYNNLVKRFSDFITVTNGNYRIKIGFKVDILNKGFVLIVDGKAQSMFAYEAIQFYKTLVGLGYYVGDGTEIRFGWVKLKDEIND